MTEVENTKDMTKKLPNGWRWVKLGEVCKVVGGSTPDTGNPNYWDGDIVWVTPTDLGKLSAIRITTTTRRITPAGLLSCGTEMLPVGTVVMSSRAPIGHLAIADVPLCTNQGCKSFVPNLDVDPNFLYWSLKQAVPDIQALGSGATFTEVSKSTLLQFAISIPSLAEQLRIAAILKDQMAAVDMARAAAQARLKAVKALPAAFLRQVFPEPGQLLPDGWRWVKLGEVCELNPRRPLIERADNELASFIPMESVNALSGTVTDLRVRPFGEIKKGYTYFAEGDVLFAKITPCMQNGKHAIALGLIDGIGFGTTEFHVLRPSTYISSEWVHFFVRRPAFLLEATDHFTGSVGQQRLPQDYLSSREIPLPPLREQHRLTALLKEQIASVEEARAAAEEELKTINALPAALLCKAFNGEL